MYWSLRLGIFMLLLPKSTCPQSPANSPFGSLLSPRLSPKPSTTQGPLKSSKETNFYARMTFGNRSQRGHGITSTIPSRSCAAGVRLFVLGMVFEDGHVSVLPFIFVSYSLTLEEVGRNSFINSFIICRLCV